LTDKPYMCIYIYLITNLGYLTEKWPFLCSYFILLGYQCVLISHPLGIFFTFTFSTMTSRTKMHEINQISNARGFI